MPYDAQKDFAPVSQAAAAPNALIVSPALGVSDVRGLVALAKGKPGQLNYATSGIGTVPHLGAVLFERLAGIELVHVPYKGTGLAIPDIARGQVALMFDNLITGQQHARAGTVRLLAVTGAKRSALLPDVPTMIEAGVPGYESVAWFGILAPARTPADVIATVNAALAAAVHAPEVRERLAAVGAEPVGGTPEALAEAMRSETEKWRRVVAAGGIKAD